MGAFFPPTVHEHTHTHTVTILRLTIFTSWCFLPDHKELSSSSSSSMAFRVWTACWWAVPALRLLLFPTGYCERLVHVKFSTRKECLHLLPSEGGCWVQGGNTHSLAVGVDIGVHFLITQMPTPACSVLPPRVRLGCSLSQAPFPPATGPSCCCRRVYWALFLVLTTPPRCVL